MQQTLTYPNKPRRGLVVGIAISILLHAVLLAMLRMPSAPPAPHDERRWTQPLTIRIVPPPPPPEPVARAEPPKERARPAARPAPARTRPERSETDHAAPPVMAVTPTQPIQPIQPIQPDRPAEPAPAESAPKFDPDAARAAARAMAKDLDTPSGNWVAEKLRKEKELQETRDAQLGRNIANSARPDCKTAYAGAGLLAPLLMLMDKKDSGCKW